jgi:carbon storage regulator CsrA
MLVLSRCPEEAIVLPTLGITVRLLRVNGQSARIGIEAPTGVPILREELAGTPAKSARKPPLDRHALRNHLSRFLLSLHLLKRQQQSGQQAAAEATFDKLLHLVELLTAELADKQPPAPPKRKCRTLVVEDDPDQAALLATLLQMHDCECATAKDGIDCLEYLRHERPDIVLMDMGLPRCDGAETVRQIRDNPELRGLKVFSISGKSPQEVGLSTGPTGVDAWFAKPVNPQKLWEAIQQALKGSTN